MPNSKSKGGTLQFVALFLALYLGLQLVTGTLFPKNNTATAPQPGPHIAARSSSVREGADPLIALKNVAASEDPHGPWGWVMSKVCAVGQLYGAFDGENCAARAVGHTGDVYVLQSRCPDLPFDLYTVTQENGAEVVKKAQSDQIPVRCPDPVTVRPGATATVSLAPWKYMYFSTPGTYEIRLPGTPDSQSGALLTGAAARFTVTEPGMFTKLFRTFISSPFLNFLIFIASVTPGHNLGIAILVLTLVVKLLLFFPTQHSLEGQKKMQMLQPKIEELRKKYGEDKQKLQEETMKLWKEHKINPFSSCLPLLIQFPVLIGLLYVIRDQSDLALSRHLIYPFYQHLTWHFGTQFLWLDLLKPDVIVMPLLLVFLQFIQMKLTFAIQKRKKKSEEKAQEPKSGSPEVMQQRMMTYLLPLMIGFFAFQFPSAVSLYWGISTLFGIGQQMIVNREHLRV